MKTTAPCRLAGLLLLLLAGCTGVLSENEGAPAAERPRLLVLTDIGGDPDDQQSMVRLLLYANRFEIEGLIASASGTPGELDADTVRPDLIRELVAAYGQVRANLLLHETGFPPADTLLARVRAGNPHRGVAHLGETEDTEGSDWIIRVADRADDRPLHIAIWGGSTELAQALWRVRNDRSPEETAAFVRKLRVYDIAAQDDTGPWILNEFPELFYVLNKAPGGADRREAAFRGMYLGGDESLTSRAWIDTHVRTGHGPLGALYPPETWTAPNPHGALKEGDTPSWFYVLPNGLNEPAEPTWGGWGGRFIPAGGGLYRDARDTAGDTTSARATVWRWRPHFQADFQARMDWCVQPYEGANHNPFVYLTGDARRIVASGDDVVLDASASTDPDGDALAVRWIVYPEAGTYDGPVALDAADTPVARLTAPPVSAPATIHVVAVATDTGTPPLTAYGRVVLTVLPPE